MSSKILIVDDEEVIRDLLRDFFEGYDYEVTTAASGLEALAVLEKEPDQVMFLDLNMPRMDGLELCRRIREKLPYACIYALTGFDRLFTSQACHEVGFDDYFKKPVDLHILHNAVLRGLEKCGRAPCSS